jgi:hypothetical protein
MSPLSGNLTPRWHPDPCLDLRRVTGCQSARDYARTRARRKPQELALCHSAHVKPLMISGNLPGNLPPVASWYPSDLGRFQTPQEPSEKP